MVRYALGSLNDAKRKASETVLKEFEEFFELETVDSESGISDMPTSMEEACEGAFNRAKNAEKEVEADFGIGIEAFVEKDKYLTIWTTVTADGSVVGEGGSGWIKLPERICSRIPEEELGDIIGEIMDDQKIREKEGVVGVLTDGRVTRKEFTETSLRFAFSEKEGYSLR